MINRRDLNRCILFYRHWRAGDRAAALRFWRGWDHNHLHVLSTKPPVVYLWWGQEDEALHEGLKNRPLIVLYLFPWCGVVDDLPAVALKIRTRLKRYPKHRVVFLCNEEATVEPLSALGVEALLVNQNAFINEDVFTPMSGIKKTHDAVYSASLAPYKRHLLAAKISSLIVMAYTYPGSTDSAYQMSVRAALKHAWWAKDSQTDAEKFTVQKIVEIYNQAGVGLCLSAIEGAMFASMEYLLCGLPVVTTKSQGGRDVFWDDRYVIVCDDHPEAVAAAVLEMKQRNLDPQFVRRLTLEKIHLHRRRLQDLLAPCGVTFKCPWPPGSHGISTWANLNSIASAIRRNVPATELP